MNFSNLTISKGEPVKKQALPITKKAPKVALDFTKDVLGEKGITPISYAEQKELSLIEPGHKIPVSNYKQIGQFCDYCNTETGHVLNEEKLYIQCQRCKKGRKLQ